MYTAERVAEFNAVAAELPDDVTPDDVTRLAVNMMVNDPPERSMSLIEAYLDAARTTPTAGKHTQPVTNAPTSARHERAKKAP